MKDMNHFTGKKNRYGRMWNRAIPYLLMAPVVIYMLAVLVVPIVYGIGLSFTNKMIGRDAQFVGLKNYISLFGEREYRKSVVNTLKYTGVTVVLKVVLGVGIALLMNSKIKFRNISRGLILIPWAVPTVVSVTIWKWMYSDTGGVLNHLLMSAGLTDQKIAWLSTPLLAFISIVIINVWRGAPFIGMSTLSGLQAVPSDVYESAQIDGANIFQRFFYITLPSIKDVVMLATLVTTIWTFNDFELIWLVTKGGPISATQTISIYTYKTGIQSMYTGKAMAASILFMPVLILLINMTTSKTLRQEEM